MDRVVIVIVIVDVIVVVVIVVVNVIVTVIQKMYLTRPKLIARGMCLWGTR